MKATSPVLPSSPHFVESILARNDKEFYPLPVAHITYSDGTRTMISRWQLTWRDRLQVLLHGSLWIEQMTQDQLLQPQLPHVVEPLKGEQYATKL